MNISIIGMNIKKIRKSKNISGYKLSQMSGVGTTSINDVENGKRQSLNAGNLEKIADTLGVTVDDLYTPEVGGQYVISDIMEAYRFAIEDNPDVTLKDEKLTQLEKEMITIGFKSLLEMIEKQRERNYEKSSDLL